LIFSTPFTHFGKQRLATPLLILDRVIHFEKLWCQW
jgi:hypothetical protein